MTLATRGKVTAEQQAAAAELLKRRRARSRFLDFCYYVRSDFVADPFHVKMADTLDRVLEGEIKKLIILAPPQHGKSSMVSELFPAYWLGRRPNDPVIETSYTISIARRNSFASRDYVKSNEFRAVFGDLGIQDVDPVGIREDKQEVTEWTLRKPYRGGLRAAGIGGSLTGYPGKLGVIDDPFKDDKEASSFLKRETAWSWFLNVFRTRIAEDGAMVVVMTRWHEDDLVGRILTLDEDWTLMRFPALSETQSDRDYNNRKLGLPDGLPDILGREPEEPLAVSRRSKTFLLNERTVNPAGWPALFQGVPRPADGTRFKRAWLRGEEGEYIVDVTPQFADRVRYWDKAGTEGDGAYTAGVLIAVKDGIYYVEDVVRGQWSAYNREQMIKETAERDERRHGGVAIWIEQEPGSGGKESAESTIRNLAGFDIRAESPVGNKDARINPFASQAEAGNVRLLRGDWNDEYIEELIAIPKGKYRDQADATAGAFNKLTKPEGTVRRTKVRRSNW